MRPLVVMAMFNRPCHFQLHLILALLVLIRWQKLLLLRPLVVMAMFNRLCHYQFCFIWTP